MGESGIEFRSLTDALDTITAQGRFFFHVTAALPSWSAHSSPRAPTPAWKQPGRAVAMAASRRRSSQSPAR